MPKAKSKLVEKVINIDTPVQSTSRKLSTRNILVIVILVIIALAWKFKGNFIAAMVNGQPVSRWQLNDRLMKKFGNQMLDSVINEKLILAAAKQKGIIIASENIDNRIKQIEGRLNGKMTLDDAIKAQGLTREDLRKELEIQLFIEKLFEKDATVSSNEIDDYVKKNNQIFKSATDTAAVNQEVKSMLLQQKTSDLFEKWFNDVRKNSKITKFL